MRARERVCMCVCVCACVRTQVYIAHSNTICGFVHLLILRVFTSWVSALCLAWLWLFTIGFWFPKSRPLNSDLWIQTLESVLLNNEVPFFRALRAWNGRWIFVHEYNELRLRTMVQNNYESKYWPTCQTDRQLGRQSADRQTKTKTQTSRHTDR